jgi:hypothetical protein
MAGNSQHATTSQSSYGSQFPGGLTSGQSFNTTAQANSQTPYPSLKDLFQKDDALWKPIFGDLVEPNKQPLFSIFRKKIERKIDIPTASNQELGKSCC